MLFSYNVILFLVASSYIAKITWQVLTVLLWIRDLFPTQTNHNVITREMDPFLCLHFSCRHISPFKLFKMWLYNIFHTSDCSCGFWTVICMVWVNLNSLSQIFPNNFAFSKKDWSYSKMCIPVEGCLSSYLNFLSSHHAIIWKDTV